MIYDSQPSGKIVKWSAPNWDWSESRGSYRKGLDFFSVHREVRLDSPAVVRLHVESPRKSSDQGLNRIKAEVVGRLLNVDFERAASSAGFRYRHGIKISPLNIAENKSTTVFSVELSRADLRPAAEMNIKYVHEALGSRVNEALQPFEAKLKQRLGKRTKG